MSRATEQRISGAAVQDDLAAYLLGIGKYAYAERNWRVEQYERINGAIRALTAHGDDDTEAAVLRYGAQLAQVNRVLAALFVDGAREAAATKDWTHISEQTIFRIARDHGRLPDYVAFAGDFAIAITSEHWDPMARYTQYTEHFLGLPEGPARYGQRLGLIMLFDGGTEAVAAGLALCDRLRGHDETLDTMASARLLMVLERGEIAGYGAAYHDLGAQLVATVGRWGLTDALPQLYRLLETTTTHDRGSRVLRALVLRAIEQLGRS